MTKFSGYLGLTKFKDSLSVNDVSQKEAIKLSAILECTWEDGSKISKIIDNSKLRAIPKRDTVDVKAEEKPKPKVKPVKKEEKKPVEEEKPAIEITERYTREDLEAIADKDGIQGLRAIGDKIGAKATSIRKLIDEIYSVAGK